MGTETAAVTAQGSEIAALGNTMKEQGLADLEVLLKNQLKVAYEPAILIAATKLKAVIPGPIDDAVIDMIVKNFGPLLKDALIEQIEKVSA